MRLLPAFLMAVVGVGLWQRPYFLWQVPPVWVVVLALAALAMGIRRVPLWALVWWLLGFASLLWTLTPATTYVAVLWTLVYTAAWAAGGGPGLFVATLVFLVADGLFSTISLQLYGLTQYFSGSVSYLTGAVGLVLLPVAWKNAVEHKCRWLRFAALVAASLAGYAALTSGARAVYLPLALLVPLMVARELRRAFVRSVVALAVIVGLVVAANAIVPGNPVKDAVAFKLNSSAVTISSPHAPASAGSKAGANLAEEGGVRSRLKMWRQTAAIGLTHPFGTGTGSFRDVIVGFQQFPTINFSSAHNAFLEVFATQGWLGIGVVLFLVATSLVRGWTNPRLWPFALGAAALWVTMTFDVTWSMPEIPLLAFWGLSVAWRRNEPRGGQRGYDRSVQRGLVVLVPLLGMLMALWWYPPCNGPSCVMGRHLGFEPEATRVLETAPPTERVVLVHRLKGLYPESVWVWHLARTLAITPSAKIAADRAIVATFPLASPSVYLELAQLELMRGNRTVARQVLRQGLAEYPPGLSPAGVPLVSRSREYASWIEGAKKLTEELQP